MSQGNETQARMSKRGFLRWRHGNVFLHPGVGGLFITDQSHHRTGWFWLPWHRALASRLPGGASPQFGTSEVCSKGATAQRGSTRMPQLTPCGQTVLPPKMALCKPRKNQHFLSERCVRWDVRSFPGARNPPLGLAPVTAPQLMRGKADFGGARSRSRPRRVGTAAARPRGGERAAVPAASGAAAARWRRPHCNERPPPPFPSRGEVSVAKKNFFVLASLLVSVALPDHPRAAADPGSPHSGPRDGGRARHPELPMRWTWPLPPGRPCSATGQARAPSDGPSRAPGSFNSTK